jgi:hypothetical protein
MTYTYIINVIAPIHVNSDVMVSYNKYPIVCITKKKLSEVFENPQIRESINKTLNIIGRDSWDKANICVRIVDNRANISDVEEPVNKIIETWN